MRVTQRSLPDKQKADQPFRNNLVFLAQIFPIKWKHWSLDGSRNHYQLHSFCLLVHPPFWRSTEHTWYRTHSILSKHYSYTVITQNGQMWTNNSHNKGQSRVHLHLSGAAVRANTEAGAVQPFPAPWQRQPEQPRSSPSLAHHTQAHTSLMCVCTSN